MLPAHNPPPYRVIQVNDDEAFLYSDADSVALCHRGATCGSGHQNAEALARAANSYERLTTAVEAALNALPVMSLFHQRKDALRDLLEAALKEARRKPHTTSRDELTRRSDAVAALLNESQKLSPEEKSLLVEEQEELSYLLSHGPSNP
jgi:hypothetical protein